MPACLTLALLLAACDSQSSHSGGDPLEIDETDYFPLELGKRWTYEYRHWSSWSGFEPSEVQYTGTVELEITRVRPAGTAVESTFEERRDLSKEFRTYQWNGTRYVGRDTTRAVVQDTVRYTVLERAGDRISHPFIDAYIVARHDVAPDTVEMDVRGMVPILGDEDASCNATARLTLVRGQGVTTFTYNCGDVSVQYVEGGSRRLVTP